MAKKHFSLKNETSLRDDISFETNDKEYIVRELTDDLMEEIAEVAENESLGVGESLSRQLAIFTGKEAGEFSELNVREKSAIIQHITSAVTDPLGNRQQRRAARR